MVWRSIKNYLIRGAREIAQGLRAFVGLAEDPGSIPNTYSGSQPSIGPMPKDPTSLLTSEPTVCMWYTDIHVGKKIVHVMIFKTKLKYFYHKVDN